MKQKAYLQQLAFVLINDHLIYLSVWQSSNWCWKFHLIGDVFKTLHCKIKIITCIKCWWILWKIKRWIPSSDKGRQHCSSDHLVGLDTFHASNSATLHKAKSKMCLWVDITYKDDENGQIKWSYIAMMSKLMDERKWRKWETDKDARQQ